MKTSLLCLAMLLLQIDDLGFDVVVMADTEDGPYSFDGDTNGNFPHDDTETDSRELTELLTTGYLKEVLGCSLGESSQIVPCDDLEALLSEYLHLRDLAGDRLLEFTESRSCQALAALRRVNLSLENVVFQLLETQDIADLEAVSYIQLFPNSTTNVCVNQDEKREDPVFTTEVTVIVITIVFFIIFVGTLAVYLIINCATPDANAAHGGSTALGRSASYVVQIEPSVSPQNPDISIIAGDSVANDNYLPASGHGAPEDGDVLSLGGSLEFGGEGPEQPSNEEDSPVENGDGGSVLGKVFSTVGGEDGEDNSELNAVRDEDGEGNNDHGAVGAEDGEGNDDHGTVRGEDGEGNDDKHDRNVVEEEGMVVQKGEPQPTHRNPTDSAEAAVTFAPPNRRGRGKGGPRAAAPQPPTVVTRATSTKEQQTQGGGVLDGGGGGRRTRHNLADCVRRPH